MVSEPKPTITATELKNNLGTYLDYVMDNNEVVITKNGRKAVRLSPYITDYDRYFMIKEKASEYPYGNKKVSYEEFMEIYENSDLRMEYIHGEIVLLASPSMEHQDISGNIHVLFRQYMTGKTCKVFYAPFDVHFFKQDFKEPDVMQPDLLIACDAEEKVTDKGRYMGTPTLVVEILSPTTRTKDMIDKLNTYMLSGVQEFWIIDPKHRNVLVYSFTDYTIDKFSTYHEHGTAVSYVWADMQLPIADIFAG